MHGASFVLDLAVVLGVAALTSVITRWLRQPTILGYLFAGLIVGPYIPIPVFAEHARIEALAELGVVLVMFAVGLEFRIAKLLRVLPTAGVTGVVQVGFILWCGFSLGQLLGWTTVGSIFLGASIAISSTMVVSKVYDQLQISGPVREHVFGVLVIQDVLAIILIAATTGIAAGGGLAPRDLALTLARLGGLLLVMMIGGLLIVPPVVRRAERFASNEILGVVAMGLCFVLALVAEHFGYSVALGAFIAGILVAESGHGTKVEHLIEPVRDIFAAIFFVSIGMTVDPIEAWRYLPTSLAVFALVIVGQFTIVTFVSVASGNGLRRSLVAGLTLGQIGEFAFIIAAVGREANVVPPSLYPVLVTVAVLTAFTTPILVGRSDAIVKALDRALPARMEHAIGLYETWMSRVRERSSASERRTIVRLLRAMALDTGALVVSLALLAAWRPELLSWLRENVTAVSAPAIVTVLALVVAIPLLIGLVRTTVQLSRLLGTELLPVDDTTSSDAARVAVRTLRAFIYLLVVLAVGVPAIAVLRPLLGIPIGGPVLLALVLGFSAYLWWTTSAVEDEFRSGTERLATALAERVALPNDTAPVGATGTLPGLETVERVTLGALDHAVGMTLAELDLRAKTGVTVIAIYREGGRSVLPTGRERLEAGDVLGLVGSPDAIGSALQLIAVG